jgi:dipeptidyl-peptidase-4
MLFTPGGVEPGQPLPVLLDPYACPHFNRVLSASRMHLESQWFADQGFVVLVVDGRGTMFRGVEWEHAVHMDFAGPIVEDQVDALFAAAERFPFLDLSRVAIRGWSGGGWLTLHAVLRRPDVFHAGIAGAPVTHWRYYDTHYTERYVGMPDGEGGVYDRNSPLTDAPTLSRPLLLIHGLTDDNVYVANTLAFSKAAMEAGRPHSWLPLSSITHRPNDPAAAEHTLGLEIRFLRDALGLQD